MHAWPRKALDAEQADITSTSVKPSPPNFRNLLELARRSQRSPFRKEDPYNVPLQEARQRFLDKLSEHSPVLKRLSRAPLQAWISLSEGAKELCRFRRWSVIQYSPNWVKLDPAPRANSTTGKKQRLHLEMLPLRKALYGLAEKFGLMHNGEPALWAMDIAVETLDQRARRLKRKSIAQWSRPIELSQGYPARTEEGWINVSTREPEKELFEIVIVVSPKQPSESLPEFKARFTQTCREARATYLRDLEANNFETRSPYSDFSWIDRFAQWQAGRNASEIAPHIKLPAFSRGMKNTGHYIGITPRLSKHNPKRRPGH